MFFKAKKEETTPERGIPKHIAFIMDGNGRWAQKRGMPREYGHGVGAKTFKKIARYCGDIGIEYVTVYAFSTENWNRPEKEVTTIMNLFSDYLDEGIADIDNNDVRYIFIGDKAIFRDDIREKMLKLEEMSKNKSLTLNFAVNYGSRDEIVNACRTLIRDGNPDITADDINSHLYTHESPDPDIIVRTGGEQRLSNFLLWQASYSEFYFTDTLWPDLTTDEIDEIVRSYSKRDRRYGRVHSEGNGTK